MYNIGSYKTFIVVAALSLTTQACALKTPDIVISGDSYATGILVNKILAHVKDESGCAIIYAMDFDQKTTKKGQTPLLAWLDTPKATAKITLKLTVDETSSLSTSALVTQPFASAVNTFPGKPSVSNPQSFTLALGAGISSEATRIDQSDYSILVKETFIDNGHRNDYEENAIHCATRDGYLTDSDLHIKDWLFSRVFAESLETEVERTSPTTLQTEITFIVTGSGNVNPTWKLIPTSVETGASPLFSVGRHNTDDIIVTLSATNAEAETQQNILKQGAADQPR